VVVRLAYCAELLLRPTPVLRTYLQTALLRSRILVHRLSRYFQKHGITGRTLGTIVTSPLQAPPVACSTVPSMRDMPLDLGG
jgi:hypothetical protein